MADTTIPDSLLEELERLHAEAAQHMALPLVCSQHLSVESADGSYVCRAADNWTGPNGERRDFRPYIASSLNALPALLAAVRAAKLPDDVAETLRDSIARARHEMPWRDAEPFDVALAWIEAQEAGL